jgi:hypothetical protein
LDIFPYLTFTDFVNFTPPTILGNGTLFLIWLWNDRRINRLTGQADADVEKVATHAFAERSVRVFNIVALVVLAAIIAFADHEGWHSIAFFVTFTAIFVVASVILKSPFDKYFGAGAGVIFDGYLSLLFVALTFGYEFAPLNMTVTTVCTTSGSEIASHVMPLDRGLMLIRKDGFYLLPWEQVRKVMSFDNAQLGKGGGCPSVSRDRTH